MSPILLVNFGGPRDLQEIESFLTELLCDRDVVRTQFPTWFHNWMFGKIARKRARAIQHDYQTIGGKSPIYFDTEALAAALCKQLQNPVTTFHRYLPATHEESFQKIDNPIVLPLFPQFSYVTSGSIARLFSKNFNHLKWIKSYAGHPAFVKSYQRRIGEFLEEKKLKEEETVLLFSAHGVPQVCIEEGDIYEWECNLSYHSVMKAFPKALGRLCYQSKFGKGEWLRPYTNEACEDILNWHQGRKNILFVPISFTSDHIETLFEIEKLYLPIIFNKKLNAYRCPALNLEPYWVEALAEIAQETNLCSNQMLIRN